MLRYNINNETINNTHDDKNNLEGETILIVIKMATDKIVKNMKKYFT